MDLASIAKLTDNERAIIFDDESLDGVPLLVWDKITAAATGSVYLHPQWIADYVNINYPRATVVHMEFDQYYPFGKDGPAGIIAVTIWLMQRLS